MKKILCIDSEYAIIPGKMRGKRALLAAVACAVLLYTSVAIGDVISGIGDMNLGGWDFSTQTTVPPMNGPNNNPDNDISFVIVVDPPLGIMVFAENGAMVTAILDSTFEELTEAPGDSSLYALILPASIGDTFVILTTEGFYAKLSPLRIEPWPIIEYVYQPNGSRILVDPVAVEATTWGRVKAAFEY